MYATSRKYHRPEATKGISGIKLDTLTCAVVCSSEMGMHLRTILCFVSTHNVGQYNDDITSSKISYDLVE